MIGGITGGLSVGVTGGLSVGVTGGLSVGVTGGLSVGVTGGLSVGVTGGLSVGVTGGLSVGVTGGLSVGVTGGLILGIGSLSISVGERSIVDKSVQWLLSLHQIYSNDWIGHPMNWIMHNKLHEVGFQRFMNATMKGLTCDLLYTICGQGAVISSIY